MLTLYSNNPRMAIIFFSSFSQQQRWRPVGHPVEVYSTRRAELGVPLLHPDWLDDVLRMRLQRRTEGHEESNWTHFTHGAALIARFCRSVWPLCTLWPTAILFLQSYACVLQLHDSWILVSFGIFFPLPLHLLFFFFFGCPNPWSDVSQSNFWMCVVRFLM